MFELAIPWILILLPLPLLIWFLWPRISLQLPAALRVPFFNAMIGIVEQEKRSLTRQTGSRSCYSSGGYYCWR